MADYVLDFVGPGALLAEKAAIRSELSATASQTALASTLVARNQTYTARDEAQMVVSSGAATADYYPTQAAGEAATTTGQLFTTKDGSGNLIYRERTAGGSIEVTFGAYATLTGEQTLSGKTFEGAMNLLDGRFGFSNLTEFTRSRAATLDILHDTITAAGAAIGLNVEGFWEGSAASPLVNNDTSLFQTYTRTLDNSSNFTWTISAPNPYNDIPEGVTDNGERVAVYGWAPSIANGDFVHRGTLGSQVGVKAAAGFRGGGHGVNARVISAAAVQGIIEADGGTIENATAGQFSSIGGDGTILANIAVFGRAIGGTVSNYSFYGSNGLIFNQERVHSVDGFFGGSTFTQSNAKFASRAPGNSLEFGNDDAAGYGSNIGSTASAGYPFIAFNAEADPTGDTYRTRGFPGFLIWSPLNGELRFASLANANASGQGPDNVARFTTGGKFETFKNPIFASVPPASATAAGSTGEQAWDAEYFYICVADNTWKRTPLSTW